MVFFKSFSRALKWQMFEMFNTSQGDLQSWQHRVNFKCNYKKKEVQNQKKTPQRP